MGKSIKGTRTEKNLGISFAGESQARMRYTYFASAAKKEGYEQIAAIFTETRQTKKRNMRNGCSNGWKAVWWKSRQVIRRVLLVLHWRT